MMKKFYIAFFLLLGTTTFAQNDFGLWSSLEVSGRVTKDITLGLGAEARFDRNVTRANNMFLAPFVQWSPIKYVRVGGEYRFQSVPFNGETANRVMAQRITLDLEFRKITELFAKKPRLGLTFRLRGTSRFERLKQNQHYIRMRLKASYNIKGTKLEPYISGEAFYHFNDQLVYTFEEVRAVHAFNTVRARVGLSYPLAGNLLRTGENKTAKQLHTLKLFLQYERGLGSGENDIRLGVGYAYRIGPSKPGKQKKESDD